MDWDNVRYFLEVARQGSVSRAAERLGVNQTTVSRRITAFEEQLGNKLFERSGSGWLITPVGERLVKLSEQMAEEANTIERQVMADSQELSGLLRITVADICTQQLAMPAIQKFAQQYPDVDIEIVASMEVLDLAAREADVALRATDTPSSNLVGKRVGTLAYAVYGNQQLRDRAAENTNNDNMPCITWIGDNHTLPPWIEKSFPKTSKVYRSGSLAVIIQMMHQGMGIAQIPCAVGDRDPLLHRIPVRYVEPGWGLWVLSHVDLRTTARVRIFRDFLVSELRDQEDLIEGILSQRNG